MLTDEEIKQLERGSFEEDRRAPGTFFAFMIFGIVGVALIVSALAYLGYL